MNKAWLVTSPSRALASCSSVPGNQYRKKARPPISATSRGPGADRAPRAPCGSPDSVFTCDGVRARAFSRPRSAREADLELQLDMECPAAEIDADRNLDLALDLASE